MQSNICSTTHVYHYLFNDTQDILQSMLDKGLRPLSDFPESEKYKQIQHHAPGMFQKIYENWFESLIGKPFLNSGIFLTPIDFHRLPGTYLHNKSRIAIPLSVIEPAVTAVTCELDGQRVNQLFSQSVMDTISETWTEALIREWFGKDNTKVFYYVPQLATYPPNGIPVQEEYIQQAPLSQEQITL